MQPWELVAVLSTTVGCLALTARLALRIWGAYQVRTLACESRALQRWWLVVGELPAELLTPPLRCALGRIMYQHLKRARRVRPHHAFLRAQILQIARFISRTPRDEGRRLTGVTRAASIAAIAELDRLLGESAAQKLISREDLSRCRETVSRSVTHLEFAHFRQAALQAEFLRRTAQAIEYLRSAASAAQRFGTDSRELREVEARLRSLEASAGPTLGAGPTVGAMS